LSTPAEALHRKVLGLTSLPTLPGVVRFISTMVEDGNVSAQDVGEVISRDQVLSSKILRMVNSPFYGFPGRISSVTHALVLLGFNVVKGLMLSTAVFDHLSSQHRGLWEHSLGVAVLSRRIAKAKNLQDVEEAMVAGLLHDLGKVVLAVVEPERFSKAAQAAEAKGTHISIAELEEFGVDHCEVARWLSERWHLPKRLTEALCLHHTPDRAKENPDVVAIVHVADIIARGSGYGYPGDAVLPPFDPAAWSRIDLSDIVLAQVMTEAERDYEEGSAIFAAKD